MPAPTPSTSSSSGVLQTLAWLRKQGFKPVALALQSKAAIDRNFVDKNYEPPPDEFWKRNAHGVGVVTGPKAKGPIDVDLDCAEAVFYAPLFLPTTPAIFGRASKPASHFLYRVTSSELDKRSYLDPVKNATIIEIRGDGGHQTVMPGSLHELTGELIQWDKLPFPDVPTVDEEVLARGVRKIAIATLVSRYIWMEGQRNEMTLPLSGLFFYLEWTLEETLQLFEAVMGFTGDDDKTRVKTVANTFRKGANGGKIVGATRLRKLVSNDALMDRLLELAGSPTINLMQEYNERYAVVNIEGKFRIADTDVPRAESPVFMQKDDFLNFVITDTIELDDKIVPKAKLWLSNHRRRTYKQVDFLPGVEETTDTLNLWTGWAVDPAPDGDCSGWLEILKTYICGGDSELVTWMLNWFANIILEPRRKTMTSPVLISKPGGGKGLLFSYFGAILGPCYVPVTNKDQIFGKFNRHLASCLLLHSDEALYGGEQAHRGIIKSLISDEFRIFEQKGIDAKRVKNFLRLGLSSNNANPAPVEVGDRRFTIIDMEDRTMKDHEVLINKVTAEKDGDGPGALLALIRKLNYDFGIVRKNIHNEASSALTGINFTPLESWWCDVLMEGRILPDYLAWAERPKGHPWPGVVSSTALYLSMVMHMKKQGVRTIPNDSLHCAQLNKFVGIKLRRSQLLFNNPLNDDAPHEVREMSDRQRAILNLPTLQACRDAFMMHAGQHIDWPGDLPEDEKPPVEKY